VKFEEEKGCVLVEGKTGHEKWWDLKVGVSKCWLDKI